MNNFTKDELEEIIMWTCHLVGCNPTLLNKIQSMIDNYCNHTKIETGAYSRSFPPKKCDACGVLYYE